MNISTILLISSCVLGEISYVANVDLHITSSLVWRSRPTLDPPDLRLVHIQFTSNNRCYTKLLFVLSQNITVLKNNVIETRTHTIMNKTLHCNIAQTRITNTIVD